MLDKNRNLLSGKDEVQSRWTEHFKEVLNREEPENPITSEEDCGFEFNEIIEEIAVSEPTLGDVKEAIKGLTNSEAPGIDYITAELLKGIVEYASIDDKNMESCKDS